MSQPEYSFHLSFEFNLLLKVPLPQVDSFHVDKSFNQHNQLHYGYGNTYLSDVLAFLISWTVGTSAWPSPVFKLHKCQFLPFLDSAISIRRWTARRTSMARDLLKECSEFYIW